MRLAEFEVQGWRNIPSAQLGPGPALNVLYGDNAQGKTNFIEAIYYLSTLRSFRPGRDFISWGGQACRLWARTEVGGLIAQLEVKLQGSSRALLVDGASVSTADEYFGGFNVVLFTPEHLRLIRGEPALRRRFMDRALFNVDRAQLQVVRHYQRVLRERNALLRHWDRASAAERAVLEVLDEQLAEAGCALIDRRRMLVAALGERLGEVHQELAGPCKKVELRYRQRGLSGPSEASDPLREAIRRGRERDLRRGFSGVGPHQDDLQVLLDGRLARETASQGETRTLVLALKIAEVLWIAQERREPPVLLLDDISSELDEHRRGVLFDAIYKLDSQAFITTVSKSTVPSAPDTHFWKVYQGVLDSVK